MTSSLNSRPPSTPPRDPRPEVMPTPPLPRPSPERGRPSRECSHRSTIWREDSVSCIPSSQSLRTPSRPSKRSSMSEEWARNEQLQLRVDFDFLTYFKQLNLL